MSLNDVCFGFTRPGFTDSKLNNLIKQIEIELYEQGIAIPLIVRIKTRDYLYVAITNHRIRRDGFNILVFEASLSGNGLS